MSSELVVDLVRDGADFPRRSLAGHLELLVSGPVRGLDMSGLAWRSITIKGESWWPGIMLGRLRPATRARWVPQFEDCDFSGMRTKYLDLGTVRFVRCSFDRAKVNAMPGTRCDLVECTFSGRIEANISGRGATVEGNDFSRVTGLGFRDGVAWQANRFDLGRSQLILQAGTAFYRACEAMEGQDHFLDINVGSLSRPRRGPIGHPGQDWVLLDEEFCSPEVWQRLLAVYDGPFGPGPGAAAAGEDRVLAPSVADGGSGRRARTRHGSTQRAADLADADLMGADLVGADLRGAVMTGADLRAADLTRADLTHADLSDADAGEVTLAGANLGGATLRAAVLIESDLKGADLSKADLTQAELGGADAAAAQLGSAVLAGAGLRSAILVNADLRGAVLTDADLRGADLRGADLRLARLEGADLREALLVGASLDGVRHGPSQVTGRPTRWPEGFPVPPGG